MSLTTSETTEAVCLISQIVGKSSGSVGGREEWAFPKRRESARYVEKLRVYVIHTAAAVHNTHVT